MSRRPTADQRAHWSQRAAGDGVVSDKDIRDMLFYLDAAYAELDEQGACGRVSAHRTAPKCTKPALHDGRCSWADDGYLHAATHALFGARKAPS